MHSIFYRIHGQFALGVEYSWVAGYAALDLGFWCVELCWRDYA